jgi:hypothetical protein
MGVVERISTVGRERGRAVLKMIVPTQSVGTIEGGG